MLLGSTWLVMKTAAAAGGDAPARQLGGGCWRCSWCQPVDAVGARGDRARWFTLPNLFWFAPVPVLVAVCMFFLLRSLARRRKTPFLLTLALVFLGYSGLGISLWPNVIPPAISIWEAAAPPQSMGFTLVGALLIIPVILMYTAFSYWVFRGKVTPGEGYH